MAATSIQWTDHSINPIRARCRATGKVGHYCEKVSAGCANCYSSGLQHRFGTPPFGAGQHRGEVELFLDDDKLREVLRRKKPTRYFWCDMTDLFGDWVNNEWLNRCFAVMGLTPHHTHQVLTKRPERMREYLCDPDRPRHVAEWMAGGAMIQGTYKDYVPPWPNPSVWLGTSVEDQATADARIPELLKVPATVRFLSVEPLLGPVDLRRVGRTGRGPDLDVLLGGRTTYQYKGREGECSMGVHYSSGHGKVDWVIVGGESGPDARPPRVEWIRDIVRQCREAKAACFVKQLGACPEIDYYSPDDTLREWALSLPYTLVSPVAGAWVPWNAAWDGQPPPGTVARLRLKDRKGGDIQEFPESLRVREFPEG